MTKLKEKIGQMLMVGLAGEALTREEQLAIKQYRFGGFILLGRNCREPAQLARLCRSLWDSETAHPPFIAIDQEGGSVHRLPPPFTHFPAAAVIGQRNDADLAYRAGRAAAAELALIGVNLNFAPVLDVGSNPKNPIIGDRSFAADPASVIKLCDKWMQGLRDGGIIPCGKHFPGHGHTDRDSHIDLPVVDRSLDQLTAVELPPFIHACRKGIEALMTAHVLYRALDPNFPATLSHAIVTGLLRLRLGYDGVVFSDDMEMKAMGDNYGPAEPAVLAVRAGIDVLLYCHDLSGAIHACELLLSEAARDAALRRRVEESRRRTAKLKGSFLTVFTAAPENEIATKLSRFDHRRLVEEIYGNL